MSSLHDYQAKTIDGKEKSLSEYSGQPVLVVNVASKCGLTPQYKGLEEIYRKYSDQGLRVLGFPCNQFMGQEPGSEEEIQQFCSTKYDVTFDMFSKIDVNGKDRHPIYEFLAGKDAQFPGDISWNFEKFLVGADGKVVERFSPRTSPTDSSITAAIEKQLSAAS